MRGILKSLRKGDIQLSSGNVSIVPEVLTSKIEQLIGCSEQMLKENKELAKNISTIKSEILKISSKPLYSEWKRSINAKILEISKITEISCTTLQNQIFLQMKENGIDLIKLAHRYEVESGIAYCPIIDYIDKDENVKMQFEILLAELIEKTANNPYYQHCQDKVVLPCPTTQSVKESINRPATAVEIAGVIMQPLIEKFDDHSSGGCATYRKVYEAMGVSWKYRTTKYMNEHELKVVPKKLEMIVNDRKLRTLFTKAIEKLLQEN